MVTYKEQINKKKYYEIIRNNKTLGVFTSLKKLCEAIKVEDTSFPSYWTIIKLDQTKPINIKDYTIQEIRINTLKEYYEKEKKEETLSV